MKTGTKVKVLAGLSEFIGQTGEVVGHEMDGPVVLNRVRLDEPVMVEGVGEVEDDLWANECLRRIR